MWRALARKTPGLATIAVFSMLLGACALATSENGTTPVSPAEALARTRDAMAAQQGFQGGPAPGPR